MASTSNCSVPTFILRCALLIFAHLLSPPFVNANIDIFSKSPSLAQNTDLQATSPKDFSSRLDIQTQIYSDPTSVGYLMKLKIGSPPKEVTGILDTGSDLIWFQCLPCESCYAQDPPTFDPVKSSTYVTASCHSAPCLAVPNWCDSNLCKYRYSYGDSSNTYGVLASEKFIISSRNKQVTAFPSISFGCGHNNSGSFPKQASGLVGLGRGPASLISQLGASKFSYCLLPATANSSGILRIGKNASIAGDKLVSTPMLSKKSSPSNYFLILEGVTVSGKKLINKNKPLDEGNIIMDSGSTFTTLERELYNNLESAVREGIELEPITNPTPPARLCYYTKSLGNVTNIAVTFHFKGADIVLPKANTFFEFQGTSCFSIMPAEDNNNIYGNTAQANFHVEYDLTRELVSFVPRDCKSFHEDTSSGDRLMRCRNFPFLLILFLALAPVVVQWT